jgi:pilus assembly protein FimV
MQAVIDLTSSGGTPLDSIKVSLATLEAHRRAGLTKAPVLTTFKFRVEPGPAGNAVVRVTSADVIREPYLEFLLELEWPNGRLLRQYTVLVDPPVTMPATPAVPPAPVTRAATRPTTPAPVRQVRPPATRPPPATVTVAPAAADEYGPIRRDDTLWSIAERVRPDDGITMHQMMLALLRANPEAFVNGNMNLLKAGSTLKVPARDEIVAFSAREALAETRRQHSEWLSSIDRPDEAGTAQTPAASAADTGASADSSGSARLQLVAPEGDAVEGAAMPGDPEAAVAEPAGGADLTQQLALATEEVEASKAQSRELQSRVDELETQIETMKRLLELKDDTLAGLQSQLAEQGMSPDGLPEEPPQMAAANEAAEAPAAATQEATVVETNGDAPAEPSRAAPAGFTAGVLGKVMDNPVLAGAGAIVVLLLGSFLWLAKRRKHADDEFDEELTLASQLATQSDRPVREWPQPVFDVDDQEPVPVTEESSAQEAAETDPIAESEVYLAYGRIQQAEDVLEAALQSDPQNDDIRLKLLEVYHIAGNTAAFDQAASDFRDGVAEDDARWIRVAAMGYAMAPQNELYRAGAPADERAAAGAGQDTTEPDDNTIEFDMDLSGMNASETVTEDELGLDLHESRRPDAGLPEDIEYGLDQLEDEDSFDGTLASEDEVTTKLDLARAYIDMDDRDSARSILGEVMEEGNAQQKQEAEKIYSQIA